MQNININMELYLNLPSLLERATLFVDHLRQMEDLDILTLSSYYIGVVFTYVLFFPRQVVTYDFMTLCFFYLLTYFTVYQCKVMNILQIPMKIIGVYILYDFSLVIYYLLGLAKRAHYQRSRKQA